MPKFLFWNLYGRQNKNRERRSGLLLNAMGELALNLEIDVFIFCENFMDDQRILKSLNSTRIGVFSKIASQSDRLSVWTRLPSNHAIEVHNGSNHARLSIHELFFPNFPPVLLACTHMHDRITIPTESGRSQMASDLAQAIIDVEKRKGYSRTVLVGDLNMNPYEAGVVGSKALHAVMTRELAERVAKLADRKKLPTFYNPMWSCFGDVSKGPAGSYYWDNATEPTNHFWQLYDQVLIRPELLNYFVGVEILRKSGNNSLVSKSVTAKPRKTFSDHLPLYFELDFHEVSMPAIAEIPDLWGDDININVVEPLIILKTQAQALSKKTKGIIQASVRSVTTGDSRWNHTLVLDASSIGLSEDALTLQHSNLDPYPCSIIMRSPIDWDINLPMKPSIDCSDQDELMGFLSTALQSPPVKIVLTNLLAKVNSRSV